MKTIRLLYPDYLGGGLDTYYFGANLLTHFLPKNENQPLLKVNIAPPDGKERDVTDEYMPRMRSLPASGRQMKSLSLPNRIKSSRLAAIASYR